MNDNQSLTDLNFQIFANSIKTFRSQLCITSFCITQENILNYIDIFCIMRENSMCVAIPLSALASWHHRWFHRFSFLPSPRHQNAAPQMQLIYSRSGDIEFMCVIPLLNIFWFYTVIFRWDSSSRSVTTSTVPSTVQVLGRIAV